MNVQPRVSLQRPGASRAFLFAVLLAAGGCSGSGGTANAVAPGATPTPSPTPTVAPAVAHVFVADQNSNSITTYATNGLGAPNETPVGNDALGLDATGNIYAANDFANSIEEFAANPSGALNEAPAATIAGGSTGLSGSRAVALR